jgi:cellulase
VQAGTNVTVEMHQHNSRGCTEEAIGGAHYGPVMVYLSKVASAATADGKDGWFKIYQDTWAANPAGSSGDDDFWGTKDLNANCGQLDVLIPADLAPGDYLLRAEALALHAAGGPLGGQFYMSCYQLTIDGSGTREVQDTVSFPGAYSDEDPGIRVSIHGKMTGYVAPGPDVIEGGTIKVAGSSGQGANEVVGGGSIGGGSGGGGGGASSAASSAASTPAASTAAASTPAPTTTAAQTSAAAPTSAAAESSAAPPAETVAPTTSAAKPRPTTCAAKKHKKRALKKAVV